MEWKDYTTVFTVSILLLNKGITLASPRLQHLFCKLSLYDLKITFLKGKRRIIADALSQVPPPKIDRLKQPTENNILSLVKVDRLKQITKEDIIPVHHIQETVNAAEDRRYQFNIGTQADDYLLYSRIHSTMEGYSLDQIVSHKYWTTGTAVTKSA